MRRFVMSGPQTLGPSHLDASISRRDNRLPCIKERSMMQPARGPRNTSKLSEPVRKQLNLYALAAGAAGVGLLASSQPLQAEVVFTATHIRLANGKIPIDLNNDGTVDFTVSNKSAGGSCCLYQRVLNVTGAFVGSSQNGVVGISRYANAIKPGQAFGPRQLFLFAPM